METRLTGAAPLPGSLPHRPEIVPNPRATRTELAPPVAVSAQVGAEMTRWKKEREESFGKRTESSIETDRETGDLVYKVIDPATRATVSQYPYESLLKLRAYIKSASE